MSSPAASFSVYMWSSASQSNCPPRCLRFHGTLFFIYSQSLSPNNPTPNAFVVQALSSPRQPNVRTGGISAHRERVFYPRRASSYYVHIDQSKNKVTVVPAMLHVAPCSVHNVMYTLWLYTAIAVVDAHMYNEVVPGSIIGILYAR